MPDSEEENPLDWWLQRLPSAQPVVDKAYSLWNVLQNKMEANKRKVYAEELADNPNWLSPERKDELFKKYGWGPDDPNASQNWIKPKNGQ